MSNTQRIGYVRIERGQQRSRQPDGSTLDRVFIETASAKDHIRPQRNAMFAYARPGDTIVAGSMADLARDTAELRRMLLRESARGVHVEFIKEQLVLTPEGSPMTDLFLVMLGAVAQFERALRKERQHEGIALARQRGVYGNRHGKLSFDQAAELRSRAAAGESKTGLAREFGINRGTIDRYLRATTPADMPPAIAE